MGFFRNLAQRIFGGRQGAPEGKRGGFFSKERREERKQARAQRKAEKEAKKKTAKEPSIQERVKEAYPSEWGASWESEREEKLKEKDQEWRVKQQQDSYKKFNENYGMSKMMYEEMFDSIGGSMDDLAMYLDGGSPTVVEMYRYYRQTYKGDPDDFVDMIRRVREDNPGLNQEQLVDRIYFEMGRDMKVEEIHG